MKMLSDKKQAAKKKKAHITCLNLYKGQRQAELSHVLFKGSYGSADSLQDSCWSLNLQTSEFDRVFTGDGVFKEVTKFKWGC